MERKPNNLGCGALPAFWHMGRIAMIERTYLHLDVHEAGCIKPVPLSLPSHPSWFRDWTTATSQLCEVAPWPMMLLCATSRGPTRSRAKQASGDRTTSSPCCAATSASCDSPHLDMRYPYDEPAAHQHQWRNTVCHSAARLYNTRAIDYGIHTSSKRAASSCLTKQNPPCGNERAEMRRAKARMQMSCLFPCFLKSPVAFGLKK
ncbi:hypothetical protein VDGL01_09127 [Verticillium dahliae]